MKRQEVGIVIVAGAPEAVVVRGAADGKEIGAVKKPVYILEAMPQRVGVLEDDAAHSPVFQVRRMDQRQGVPLDAGAAAALAGWNIIRQGPVAVPLGVLADGELGGAAGEVQEAGL